MQILCMDKLREVLYERKKSGCDIDRYNGSNFVCE